jgi:adenylate cyclase
MSIHTFLNPAPATGKSVFEVKPHRCLVSGQAVPIVVTGTLLGLLYPVLGDGFTSIIPYVNGLLIGFFGGVSVSIIELFLFRSARKNMNFLLMVFLKSMIYSMVITFYVFSVILISRALQSGNSVSGMLRSDAFQHFLFHEDFIIIILYALMLVSLIIFTREMSRKMGQGVLFDFLTGRYFKPRTERRIFMFLDMNSSVSQAEFLGDMAYHNLLNDFFHDITSPVIMTKGRIHHYVGDEVVVSWPLTETSTTDGCLSAYLYCYQKIQSLKSRYESAYGAVPSFKAAFHCGEVICGEIGEVKSEIVFHGDVVNTTARMERLCSSLGENILVSTDFFERLSPDCRAHFRIVRNVRLTGKDRTVDIYRLAESPEARPDVRMLESTVDQFGRMTEIVRPPASPLVSATRYAAGRSM